MTDAIAKADQIAALVKSAHDYADSTLTPGVRAERGSVPETTRHNRRRRR